MGKDNVAIFGGLVTGKASFVHGLVGTTNLRVSVFVQWIWTFLTGQRGSRLIVNHHPAEIAANSQVPQEPARVVSQKAA
jgi:hypothetical protein